MIHYQLQCSKDHGFDGWFKDSAAFDRQAKRGLLSCPLCGDAKVAKSLMAPSVPRKGNAIATVPAAPPAKPARTVPMAVTGERMPDQMRAMLQKLRADVERNCDYVGEQFAEEARRIHNGESDVRGIYGEASPEDAESLAEDGIQIARIPWVPRADG